MVLQTITKQKPIRLPSLEYKTGVLSLLPLPFKASPGKPANGEAHEGFH